MTEKQPNLEALRSHLETFDHVQLDMDAGCVDALLEFLQGALNETDWALSSECKYPCINYPCINYPCINECMPLAINYLEIMSKYPNNK